MPCFSLNSSLSDEKFFFDDSSIVASIFCLRAMYFLRYWAKGTLLIGVLSAVLQGSSKKGFRSSICWFKCGDSRVQKSLSLRCRMLVNTVSKDLL